MSYPSINSSLVEVTSILKTNYRVFFKNELDQPSGSFKLRGLGHLVGKSIQKAREEGKKGVKVFSSSGGNAGLAAAYASKYYQVPCTVVLPKISKQVVIHKLEELGAEVIVHGNHWGEADEYLRETVIKSSPSDIYPVYCHPFDNPTVWEGHAAIIDDLPEQFSASDLSNLKAVVCSVGGGGLYNGIVEGLKRNNLNDVAVVAVETKQAACFHEGVKQGKSVRLEKVPTLAISLASPYISEKSLENYKSTEIKTHLELIDDKDSLQGTVDYYDTFDKRLIEPACGASTCTVMSRTDLLDKLDLKENDIVVVIVCGGVAINDEILQEYRDILK
ncbi:catabolic L-serine/threonine dehydratase [[Candida] railenensis]|uniref:L-serine ammonia-lyase n=1 Tax=[Candida] railenensis TaxID=45579 RepID=A0A9P0QVZ5_9ASCO|nr:catabolic L-serine/threonine dehydratase [[Candida] railenensis]